MKKLKHSQGGFIPLLIILFLVVIGIITLVYLRVQSAN